MRYIVALAILALATASAPAQEPKPLKTIRIEQPPPTETNLFVVEDDGTVRIDWDAVETLASSKADRLMLLTAQVMLAIRDRTWKPMN